MWLPQRFCSTLTHNHFKALYLEAGVHCGPIVAAVEGALDGVLRLPCPLLQETQQHSFRLGWKLLAGIYNSAITGVGDMHPWTMPELSLPSAQ